MLLSVGRDAECVGADEAALAGTGPGGAEEARGRMSAPAATCNSRRAWLRIRQMVPAAWTELRTALRRSSVNADGERPSGASWACHSDSHSPPRNPMTRVAWTTMAPVAAAMASRKGRYFSSLAARRSRQ